LEISRIRDVKRLAVSVLEAKAWIEVERSAKKDNHTDCVALVIFDAPEIGDIFRLSCSLLLQDYIFRGICGGMMAIEAEVGGRI
jgi:hypothetical protein